MLQALLKPFLKKIPKLVKDKALPGILKKAENYRDSIELEPGEIAVMGLVFLENGKCYIAPCTMRVSDNGKLGVSRNLQKYDLGDLVNLLVGNLENADLSNILTELENE